MSDLRVVPITLKTAKEFVNKHHRHHKAPVGHKFSIGIAQGVHMELVGVAIAGRPTARAYDNGHILEVTRSCVLDGVKNGNSMLYGAVRRIAKAMGYSRCITYTQDGETGISLRAAGWKPVANLPPRKGWNAPSRERAGNGNDDIARIRWEVDL